MKPKMNVNGVATEITPKIKTATGTADITDIVVNGSLGGGGGGGGGGTPGGGGGGETGEKALVVALRSRAYGPKSTYAKPTGAVDVAVGQLTQALLDSYATGTKFYLAAGVHRLDSTAARADGNYALALVPRQNQELHGAPGAIIAGSRLLTSWVQSGSTWYSANQFQRARANPYPAPNSDSYTWTCKVYPSTNCELSEDLWINGTKQERVTSLASVTSGKWFFDTSNSRAYIGTNPAGQTVEIATADGIIRPSASGVRVQNLVLRHALNPAQTTANTNASFVDCEIAYCHGTNVSIASGTLIEGCYIHHGGQFGAGGTGTAAIFRYNRLAYNNDANFNDHWYAGGSKFDRSTNCEWSWNWAHDNNGVGLALDIDNSGSNFHHNLCENNIGSGMVFEYGYGGTATYNYCRNNGINQSWWNERCGILMFDVQGWTCEGNWIENGGINVRMDNRTARPVNNIIIRNNEMRLSSGFETGMNIQGGIDANSVWSTCSYTGNTYYVTSTSGSYWHRQYDSNQSGLTNWTGWRNAGNDTTGTLIQG